MCVTSQYSYYIIIGSCDCSVPPASHQTGQGPCSQGSFLQTEPAQPDEPDGNCFHLWCGHILPGKEKGLLLLLFMTTLNLRFFTYFELFLIVLIRPLFK